MGRPFQNLYLLFNRSRLYVLEILILSVADRDAEYPLSISHRAHSGHVGLDSDIRVTGVLVVRACKCVTDATNEATPNNLRCCSVRLLHFRLRSNNHGAGAANNYI